MVVNPAASTAHDVSDSLAARAWRDAHDGDDGAPPVDFEVVYEQTLGDGARAVARAIQSFRCALACKRRRNSDVSSLSACLRSRQRCQLEPSYLQCRVRDKLVLETSMTCC